MYQYLMKCGMVTRGNRQLVINTTTAIGITVHQHDDVLKGDT